MMQNQTKWSPNIIIADADYIDKVAFDLTVNFERMLERRIPQADMARWVECVALDGGLREGKHETTVILIHEHDRKKLENFTPGNYNEELNGQAFSSRLGEFVFYSIATEDIADKQQLFTDTLSLIMSQHDVKRIMVVPNEQHFNRVRTTIQRSSTTEQDITLFSMQPLAGGSYRQEILGYSLMAALGIRGDEFKADS